MCAKFPSPKLKLKIEQLKFLFISYFKKFKQKSSQKTYKYIKFDKKEY